MNSSLGFELHRSNMETVFVHLIMTDRIQKTTQLYLQHIPKKLLANYYS
jgi:hypothetical protein